MNKVCAQLFLIIAGLSSLTGADDPCSFYMSVDITGGYPFQNGSVRHGGVVYSPSQFYEYKNENGSSHIRGCICSIKPCLRKCCPPGQAFVGRDCADSQDSLVNLFSPTVYSLEEELPETKAELLFGLVFGIPCENDQSYALNPYSPPEVTEDMFYLQKSGHLYVPGYYSGAKNFSLMSYCLDAFPEVPEGYEDSNWTTKYLPLICAEDSPEVPAGGDNDIVFIAFFVGMMISLPFLVATFLVYAVVPELRNLHGKALMSYVAGLTLAFIFLVADQTMTRHDAAEISQGVCLFMAFTVYFFFMVSFFWVNVMCFDIWWTFRLSIRAPRRGRHAAERRRFIIYCLYAWGAPLVLTGLCALMQFHDKIPNHIVKPRFGETRCWFSDWKSQLIYFSIPVIVLVVCNLILFACTSYNILMIRRETSVLKAGDNSRNDRYNKEKQRFYLYLKLFLVMGVNWAAEMLSFMLGGSDYIWIVTDLCNTMLGVFIFIIFVWKKKVRDLLIKRYHQLRYGLADSPEQFSSRFRSRGTESGIVDESSIRLN